MAGGCGTRLYPMTAIYSKQLINIYDKPMIYYPLSLLMLVGIKDIIIISDIKTIPLYDKLFGNGSDFGINIEYVIQFEPKGIAEAFILTEEYIKNDNVVLILGDNLFYGDSDFLRKPLAEHKYATIFAYRVNNPQNYGVVEFNSQGNPVNLIEKPANPPSNYAIPGLYIYDNTVVDRAKHIIPSHRGELEITDVNMSYLDDNNLCVEKIGRGIAWLDTGTPQSLMEANNFISAIECRQGLKVGCIEEIAFNQGYINIPQFKLLIENIPNSQYKEYLKDIIND